MLHRKILDNFQFISSNGESLGNLKTLPLKDFVNNCEFNEYECILFTFHSTIGSFSSVIQAAKSCNINIAVLLIGCNYEKRDYPKNMEIYHGFIDKNRKFRVRNNNKSTFIANTEDDWISVRNNKKYLKLFAESSIFKGQKIKTVNFGFKDKIFRNYYEKFLTRHIDHDMIKTVKKIYMVIGSGNTLLSLFHALKTILQDDEMPEFHIMKVGKSLDTKWIEKKCEGIVFIEYSSEFKYYETGVIYPELPSQFKMFEYTLHYDGKALQAVKEDFDFNRGDVGLFFSVL